MFKAQKGLTQEEIIIPAPCWNEENILSLRQQGHNDELICPVCKQPVLVKAGKKKRWHFAHKDLTNCPLKNESAGVLQARFLLYSWLNSKLEDKVTIEKHFPATDLPRPVDCYVELSDEQKIGYWILERGSRDRWMIHHALSNQGVQIVWVPLASMLREDDEEQDTVHLTPTERDITYSSDYNHLYSHFDSSLSYLNVEEKAIVTLRGLRCIHSPQKYLFDFKLITDLDQMLFLPRTGELVHPGEHEQFEELKRREQKIELQKERAEQERAILPLARNQTMFKPQPPLQTNPPKEKDKPIIYDHLNKPYPCRVCGTMTTNWSTLNMKDKTCICSLECLAKSQHA